MLVVRLVPVLLTMLIIEDALPACTHVAINGEHYQVDTNP